MVDEIIGKYKVLRAIGAGGMATVFLASHSDVPNLKVVLKKLTDPQLAERFKREADKLAVLDGHSGICQIKHFFEFRGDFYIVMEYINGPTLDELVKADDPPDIPQALKLTRAILTTLDYAHRLGIVHRDIKPTNIMVDHIGQVKIIDFGVAKGAADPDLTQAGTSLGSPRYMAPEQFNPQGPVDWVRCDVYAVGMTLYYLLTRSLPYHGTNIYEMCDAKRREDAPAPSLINTKIPPAVDAVVLKAMARNPQDRFASAGEMRSALQGLYLADPAPLTDDDDSPTDRTMVLGSTAAVDAGITMSIKPAPTPAPPTSVTGSAETVVSRGTPAPTGGPAAKSRRTLYLIGALLALTLVITMGVVIFAPSDEPVPPVVEVLPPSLLSPASGSALADGRVEFQWDTAGDSLGVFTLQYAGDPDLDKTVIKLEQRGGRHRLAKALATGVYFWRVRAGALTAPDTLWSPAKSFSVSARPASGGDTDSDLKPTPQEPKPQPKPKVIATGEALIGARLDGVNVIADGALFVDGKRRDFHFPDTVELSAGEHAIIAVYMYEGKEVKARRTITVIAKEKQTVILDFDTNN